MEPVYSVLFSIYKVLFSDILESDFILISIKQTDSGLSVGEFSFFFFFFNVHAFSQAPLWAYLLCAVGLFVYQSLDAIDGKQARRTNSSSPLGELFDHGCDSLSTGTFLICSTLFPPRSRESEAPNMPSCLLSPQCLWCWEPV